MGVVDGGAAVDGVLLAFNGAGVVFKAAKGVGDAEIGLEDAAEHFQVEAGLEGFGGFQIGVGVGVFGFEIGADAGILFVAEPGVVVDAAVGVDNVFDGFAEGERGLESGGAGSGGGGGLGGEVGGGGIGVGRHWVKRRFIFETFAATSERKKPPPRKAAATKATKTREHRLKPVQQVEFRNWWNTLLGHLNRRWVGITACWYGLVVGKDGPPRKTIRDAKCAPKKAGPTKSESKCWPAGRDGKMD